MRHKNRWRRLTALLLCAALQCILLAPVASAEEGVVHIRSQSDWEQLIQNCRLDTWSQGKTVVLDCDLTGIGAASIPTFGGTFDGQGHTIYGLRLSDEGDHQGLFRYVQEGAVIKNLSVSGVVTPDGTCSAVGGIAGVNSGTIMRCSYQGVVAAVNQVGGIAGVNEAAGQIINCTAKGSVTGEHYTGGIVGENYGTVTLCTNWAQVNTQQTDSSTELSELDLERLNSTENIPARMDTGGIAGYSKGILQSCTNRGLVGYPHIGYNVGGIVGRQSGYVDGCVNHGTVQGRKEVGGIVGQIEPYTLLKFQEDTLHSLLDELEVLNGLLVDTLDDTDASRQQLSAYLTAASDLTDSARQDASSMLDDVLNLGDEAVDTVNDLSARVSRVLDQSIPVVENLQDFSSQLGRAVRRLESGFAALESASESGSSAVSELRRGLKALGDASDQVESALGRIKAAAEALKDALGDSQETGAALAELEEAALALKQSLKQAEQAVGALVEALGGLENLPNWGETDPSELAEELEAVRSALAEMEQPAERLYQAVKNWAEAARYGAAQNLQQLGQTLREMAEAVGSISGSGSRIKTALEHLEKMGPHLEDAGEELQTAVGEIRSGLSAVSKGSGSLSSALDDLRDILKELSEEPELTLPKLDSAFREREDRLEETLDDLMTQFDGLRQTAQEGGDALSSNLRGITDQFQVIIQVLQDAQEEPEDEERVVDISEEDVSSITLGKVSGCTNYGDVDGDVNIGGLTGSMAIEFDFDPEDDITSQGSYSLNFQYLTRAVLSGGVNYGQVTARKNGAGGIVGRMGLGLVMGCQSYGDVESTRGEYVGGIAGISNAVIRDSWAKCTLSGSKYVGGIAGLGTEISGCGALVEIAQGTSYIGAIAGKAEGTLHQNYFVSSDLGGVDQISYAGKAEPLDYEDFLGLEGVPDAFQSFSITFLAQGETVDVVSFQYGGSISEEQIPQVPEREGFCGQWEDFDRQNLRFDIVVEAVYTPWLTAISSEDGAILAEGTFRPGSSLRVTQADGGTPPLGGGEELWGQWLVETGDDQSFTALRLAAPEGSGRVSLWVYDQQTGWRQLACTREGSYLRAEVSGQSALICVTQSQAGWLLWAVLACAAAALVVLLAVGVRRRKKQKPAPQQTEEKCRR